MIRSFTFHDENDPDRELVVSEVPGFKAVELRCAGFGVTIPAAEWPEFAQLVASTLQRYGTEPRLRLDLGNVCKECNGLGDVPGDQDDEGPHDCSPCEGRGFLLGEPEKSRKKGAF